MGVLIDRGLTLSFITSGPFAANVEMGVLIDRGLTQGCDGAPYMEIAG